MAMSSLERLISVLNLKKPDYVPCSFMQSRALRSRYKNENDYIEKMLELGLDVIVLNHKDFHSPLSQQVKIVEDFQELSGLPARFHPTVKVKEWIEDSPEEIFPILHKKYFTP